MGVQLTGNQVANAIVASAVPAHQFRNQEQAAVEFQGTLEHAELPGILEREWSLRRRDAGVAVRFLEERRQRDKRDAQGSPMASLSSLQRCCFHAGLVHVAADSGKDRFLTELVIPAIVDSISFVEKLVERRATFKDLAVTGGHAMLWAFIGAFDEALAASGADTEKEMWLLKLYEASLMFTVRVRNKLSPLQITLDNLSSADCFRTRRIAEKDSKLLDVCLRTR